MTPGAAAVPAVASASPARPVGTSSDPEPHKGLPRTPGQVRAMGYVLLWLLILLWAAIYARASEDRAPSLGGGIVPLVVLATLAWWALSIARRREAWARRQLVRDIAAESAQTGIPHVVEGVDPDPYPDAVLSSRAEVIWGLILLAVSLVILVAGFSRPQPFASLLIVAPVSVGAGVWLLRIAQARIRYAARQAQRADAVASRIPVPASGDPVPDPEPYPWLKTPIALIRMVQRALVVVAGVAWAAFSATSPTGLANRMMWGAIIVPLLVTVAVVLLQGVRAKEEWIFRERARAAILDAARTRVRTVTAQLDPSWRAGTLTAPESKLRAFWLIPLSWCLTFAAVSTDVLARESVWISIVMSTVVPAMLWVSYRWEQRRQALAAAEGVVQHPVDPVAPTTPVPDPEPYPVSKLTPGQTRATAYVLIGGLPMLWAAEVLRAPQGTESGLGVLNSFTVVFLLLAWWTLSVARRREAWARRELVRSLAALSAADRVPYVVPAVDPDPYPSSSWTVAKQTGWGAVLMSLPLALGAAAVLGGRSDPVDVMPFVGWGLIFGGWLLRIARARRRYAARQRQRAAVTSGAAGPTWVNPYAAPAAPAATVASAPPADPLPDPEPFAALPGSAGFWRRLQRALVACLVIGWIDVAVRTDGGHSGSLAVPALIVVLAGALAAAMLVVARRREEWRFRHVSRAAIEDAARTGRPVVTIPLDPSLRAGTFVSPRSKLAGLGLVPLSVVLFAALGSARIVGNDAGVAVLLLAFAGLVALLVTFVWERRRLAMARQAFGADAPTHTAPI